MQNYWPQWKALQRTDVSSLPPWIWTAFSFSFLFVAGPFLNRASNFYPSLIEASWWSKGMEMVKCNWQCMIILFVTEISWCASQLTSPASMLGSQIVQLIFPSRCLDGLFFTYEVYKIWGTAEIILGISCMHCSSVNWYLFNATQGHCQDSKELHLWRRLDRGLMSEWELWLMWVSLLVRGMFS